MADHWHRVLFDGTPWGVTVEQLITNVEDTAALAENEHDNLWKAEYAATCLQDDAALWYDKLPGDQRRDWQWLRNALFGWSSIMSIPMENCADVSHNALPSLRSLRTRIPPVSVIAPPHLYALPRILPPPGPKIGRLSIKSVKGEHRGWLASGHRKSGKCPLTSEYRKALVVTYAPGKTPGTFNIINSTSDAQLGITWDGEPDAYMLQKAIMNRELRCSFFTAFDSQAGRTTPGTHTRWTAVWTVLMDNRVVIENAVYFLPGVKCDYCIALVTAGDGRKLLIVTNDFGQLKSGRSNFEGEFEEVELEFVEE